MCDAPVTRFNDAVTLVNDSTDGVTCSAPDVADSGTVGGRWSTPAISPGTTPSASSPSVDSSSDGAASRRAAPISLADIGPVSLSAGLESLLLAPRGPHEPSAVVRDTVLLRRLASLDDTATMDEGVCFPKPILSGGVGDATATATRVEQDRTADAQLVVLGFLAAMGRRELQRAQAAMVSAVRRLDAVLSLTAAGGASGGTRRQRDGVS